MIDTAQQNLKKAVNSEKILFFFRLGCFVRGVLYLISGFIALLVTLDYSRPVVDTTGAIVIVKTSSIGNEAIILIIFGLVGYSLWGITRAGIDFIYPGSIKINIFQRMSYLFSAFSYGSLAAAGISLIVKYREIKSETNLKHFIEFVFHLPYGNLIVFLIGMIGITGGISQIIKAVKADEAEDFWGKSSNQYFTLPFIIFAKIGIAVRGLVFVSIGYSIIYAGIFNKLSVVGGLETTLNILKTLQGGGLIMAVIGVGLIFFGLYSVMLSFLLNLPNQSH